MNPYKLREVYKQLTSQNSILKKYLKLGTKDIKQPDLPAFVEQKNAVNRFVRDNPRPDQIDRKDMAGGGRIGFYKGMRADKAKKKIKLKEPVTLTGKAGDRKLTAKQIDALDPNYLGDFTGGDLERPKKVYKSGTPNSVIDDAIEIRNIIVNNKGNIFGLEELGEKAQIYTSGTGTRKSGKGNRPDIRRVRAALALAKDSFPEIANFKFVTDRYKIDGSQRQQLNMVVDTIKAYQSATGDEKLAQFLPDNMGQFYTRVIEKGPKKLPGKPEQGLYIKMYNFGPEQIKYISDRITDETGQKFTSKDYKNLITDVKKYRASVSGDARIQTRLANINKQIKNLAEDSVIQNLLKGDLNRKTQEALLERATRLVGGDASIASRRLFMMAEAMSDTTNAYKNLGIKLNNEKANKIIATGKQIGGRNNRYGMSSVLYDYYGNVVDKAIGSGEGQTFVGKYQQAIRNTLDKGLSPDEIFSLTASARRGLSPYALFTQQLRTDVNSAIKGAYIDSALSRTHGKLQEIFNGRKYSQLNAAEKKAANALVEAFEKEKTRALNQPVNPGEVKKGAKPIYLTAAEKKNIQLPSFDLKNPPSKSIEGFATRFVKYPQIKEAFEKSYKDVGYSMKVTKDMKTQKEFLSGLKEGTPKEIAANLRKLGFKCKFANKKADGGRIGLSTGTGRCDDPMSYVDDIKKQEDLLKVQTKKAPQAVKTLNTARKLNAVRSLFTSTLGPGALAFEAAAALPIAYMGYKGGKTPENILADSTFNLIGKSDKRVFLDKAVEMGFDTANIKRAQDLLKKQEAFEKQDARADEFMGPDDLFMYPQMVQKAERDLSDITKQFIDSKTGQVIPERVAAFDQLPLVEQAVAKDQADLAAERQEQVGNVLERPITDYLPGLAGGGIAKLAGVDSGPPPESGPMSEGLQGLMKRVRNL